MPHIPLRYLSDSKYMSLTFYVIFKDLRYLIISISVPMCATFEYLSGGCLYEFLSCGFIGIGEKPALLKDRYNQPRVHSKATLGQLLRIASDVALGMTYLSSNKVCSVILSSLFWVEHYCWILSVVLVVCIFVSFNCFCFSFVVWLVG